jgi:cell division protein FtsB|tara:strand:+ start:715 stop:999 length:285 start_codon:yes stop_codon:yes gene_type:complete
MSILRRTQIANNHREEILINKNNQETIMMQQEEIYALRAEIRQKVMKIGVLQTNNKKIEERNRTLLTMFEQTQYLINTKAPKLHRQIHTEIPNE